MYHSDRHAQSLLCTRHICLHFPSLCFCRQSCRSQLLQTDALQDRISSDGTFTPSTDLRRTDADPAASHLDTASQAVAPSRPPGLPDTAPVAHPISQQDLRRVADWVASRRQLVVLTGAGCSTESNIPDYRGPKGAYSTGFTPMTHQQVTPSTSSGSCCACSQHRELGNPVGATIALVGIAAAYPREKTGSTWTSAGLLPPRELWERQLKRERELSFSVL